MTSMPASRSALATTLAPRSCPSSPGLATTTRMRPCATVPAAPLAVACRPGLAAGPHLARYYPAISPPQRPILERTTAVPTSDPPPPPRPDGDPGQVPLRPGRDPGGRVAYLPPRAARARKLILRSQLGRGWIVASALFGVVILAAGVLFLTRAGHPGPPWVRVAAVSALPAGTVSEVAGPAGQGVGCARRAARRPFLGPPGPCRVVPPGGGFARPCAGQRWDAARRPTAGGAGGPPAPPPLRRGPAPPARPPP